MVFARGFVLLQHLLPKRAISDTVGWLTRRRGGVLTRLAIGVFVRVFGVDMSEAESAAPADYPTFNAFFTRALKPGARPVVPAPDAVACPADGTISALGTIDGDSVLQVKGLGYRLADLFDGDNALAERFVDGRFCTIYLAPYNYHRVHMPLAGEPAHLRYVPGRLYSVNAATTRLLPRLFCINERVAVTFTHPQGEFALVMVGAMNVGSIDLTLPSTAPFSNRPATAYAAGITHPLEHAALSRSAEFGRFNMGSTVVVLAAPGLLEWASGAGPGRTVRVGETLAHLVAES